MLRTLGIDKLKKTSETHLNSRVVDRVKDHYKSTLMLDTCAQIIIIYM